ncbi:transposable element Tcb1 transposase [Trichonephila clavipes]|nr:transposable element Tcb1 transposase [Trichonephila clavipes]
MGLQFLFMDDNAPCHRTVAAEQLLESEDIERMDWPARCPDLNLFEHVWDFLGRRLAARTLPPVTIRELRLALQDKWAAMPQQLIDTLILSMGRRCETCLAPRFTHSFKHCQTEPSLQIKCRMILRFENLVIFSPVFRPHSKGYIRLHRLRIHLRGISIVQENLRNDTHMEVVMPYHWNVYCFIPLLDAISRSKQWSEWLDIPTLLDSPPMTNMRKLGLRLDTKHHIIPFSHPSGSVPTPSQPFTSQDYAEPHTTRVSMNCLTANQALYWPSISPDPSPIEHVWDMMGRRLHLPGNVDILA